MIGFAAQRLMDLEVGALTGAGYGEKSSDRLAQRNGYRERDWETRAGTVELHIPRLRTYMSFSPQHRAKLHNTNPLERLNGEIKRRTGVVSIFPHDDATTRLVGALLLEQKRRMGSAARPLHDAGKHRAIK